MATLRYRKTLPEAFDPLPMMHSASAFILRFPHDFPERYGTKLAHIVPFTQVDLGLTVRISSGYVGRIQLLLEPGAWMPVPSELLVPSDQIHPLVFSITRAHYPTVSRGKVVGILWIEPELQVSVIEECGCKKRKLTAPK